MPRRDLTTSIERSLLSLLSTSCSLDYVLFICSALLNQKSNRILDVSAYTRIYSVKTSVTCRWRRHHASLFVQWTSDSLDHIHVNSIPSILQCLLQLMYLVQCVFVLLSILIAYHLPILSYSIQAPLMRIQLRYHRLALYQTWYGMLCFFSPNATDRPNAIMISPLLNRTELWYKLSSSFSGLGSNEVFVADSCKHQIFWIYPVQNQAYHKGSNIEPFPYGRRSPMSTT